MIRSSLAFPSLVNALRNETMHETVSNRRSANNDLSAALTQLEAISALSKNWDSYGSVPPGPSAIFAARRLIVEAYRQLPS